MKFKIQTMSSVSRLPHILMVLLLLATEIVQAAVPAAEQNATDNDYLLKWLNIDAQAKLAARAEAIQAIHTTADAEARGIHVREEILKDIGGLPSYDGPLHAKVTGELHAPSYTIEKIIYESLPGLYITANLYRPNGAGPFPAVLLQSGHTQEGKTENQLIAANLAVKNFIVLCFDPIGQGERVQTNSRDLGGPLAGWSVPEHIVAGAQTELIGQGLARYFIWDAMRSLDYLSSRPDVDASRIGAAGCSGGGALTTFIGALDSRIKAVVPACYPSTFSVLFPTTAAHGEMVFPRLLSSGLDTADLVEMSAPKPWLLQATEVDQYGFSSEGVREVYKEAQHWYELFNASGNVSFVMGPGTHGMPLSNREALYGWMIRWLKENQGDFREQPVPMFSNVELQVTKSGQVEDEPGSRKLYQIVRSDLNDHAVHDSVKALKARLKTLGIVPGNATPPVRIVDQSRDQSFVRQKLQLESEQGIWINAVLYLPSSEGRKPAVILVDDAEQAGGLSVPAMAAEMADAGRIVLQLEPRRSHVKNTSGPYTNDWMTNVQSDLIGKNLPAMRARDILRGVDLLCSRQDVDPRSIRGAARGVAGIWLLMAAAADSRLEAIWLDRTPYSLRSALDTPIPMNLWNAVIPGFVLHWDLQDLVEALEQRRVLWTDPCNWDHNIVKLGTRYRYRYVVGDLTDKLTAQDEALVREFIH